jgi:hypothetical protein
MKERCNNPNSTGYSYYGGRGIKVCDRWAESPEAFVKDMGARPSPRHSIDRIDCNGDYGPDNCRWATARQQSDNRRNTRFLEIDGECAPLGQWSDRSGIDVETIRRRLDRLGWSAKEAVYKPKMPYPVHKANRLGVTG